MKKDEYITITKESYQQMNHLLIERAKQVERLQEQLNEANEIIKKYRRFDIALKVEKGTLTGVYPAVDYLKKYNIS